MVATKAGFTLDSFLGMETGPGSAYLGAMLVKPKRSEDICGPRLNISELPSTLLKSLGVDLPSLSSPASPGILFGRRMENGTVRFYISEQAEQKYQVNAADEMANFITDNNMGTLFSKLFKDQIELTKVFSTFGQLITRYATVGMEPVVDQVGVILKNGEFAVCTLAFQIDPSQQNSGTIGMKIYEVGEMNDEIVMERLQTQAQMQTNQEEEDFVMSQNNEELEEFVLDLFENGDAAF